MYYEFRTFYAACKNPKGPLGNFHQFTADLKGVSAHDFYQMMCQDMLKRAKSDEQFAVEHNRCLVERFWYDNGTPYYKVDNAAIELFREVNMDIPFKYLFVPFNSFCICFETDNPFVHGGRRVQSMLVTKIPDEVGNDHFYLWVDSGDFDAGQAPQLEYVHTVIEPERSIDESIRLLPVSGTGSDLRSLNYDKQLMSIALSVCFLATSSDKMIRPDVLSKDLAS